MVKPTLLQSILGRPSQSYHFPPNKEYHSTRHDLLRAATQPGSSDEGQLKTHSIVSAPDSESGYFSSSSTGSLYSEARSYSEASTAARWSRTESKFEDEPVSHRHSQSSPSRRQHAERPLTKSTASSQNNTDSHAIFTASSSSTPATSFYSNTATTPKPSPLSSLSPSSLPDDKLPSPLTRAGHEHLSPDSSDNSSDDGDDDVFYTPRSSLYGSPRASRTSAAMLIDPKALIQALLPLPSSPITRSLSQSSAGSKNSRNGLNSLAAQPEDSQESRTSSDSLISSSSASSSADGTAVSTQTAMSRGSTSVRVTTPPTSDYGSPKRNGLVETITIARSTKSQTASSVSSGSTSQPVVRGQPRPLSATRKRSQTEIRRNTYTDEDWAKDVRWLAPAISSGSESPRRHSRPLPPTWETSSLPSTPSLVSPSRQVNTPPRSYPPPSKSAEHRRRSRRSRGSRSSRGRMSALLEEDESEYSDITPNGSSPEHSRAPSPVLEEGPSRMQESPPELPSITSPQSSVGRNRSHRSAKDSSISSSDEASENPDARLKAYAASLVNGRPRRSYSNTRRLSRSISPTLFSFSQTLPTHSIPTPVPFAEESPAPSGYSGLTLPRAAYAGNGKASTDNGKVDLVRAGVAQSSMATVEVTRGVAQQNKTSDARKKRRHFSFQLSLKLLDVKVGRSRGKGKETATPAHLLDSLPLPVAFLSHLPPPSYVPSAYVLVQVFAVGLDSLDSLLVQDKLGNSGKGTGFIPGRSIVGKVIEVGWEVKADVCKKGEWIIGLADVKKCGALAEFVVLERHRVHRAPQPLSRPATLFPATRRSHVRSKSLPSQMNPHPYAQLHRDLISSMNMTIEELALLPLCALPAHRAVRTCADVIAPAKPRPDRPGSRSKQPRALVLQGHDGAGALAVQMLARRGVQVWVQVPDSAARDENNEGDDENTDTSLTESQNPARVRPPQTRFDQLDARLRAWGAEEICVGEPLEVLERLAEDGRSFDAIIDTVGGVEIWEMGRKLLLNDPEMDTTQQNEPLSPTSPSGQSGTASSSSGSKASSSSNNKKLVLTQFTSLVGDTPSRPIPSGHDNFRTGFRTAKRSVSSGSRSRSGSVSPSKSLVSVLSSSPSKDSLGPILRRGNSLKRKGKIKRSVNYAWVSVAADLDFEGEDVRDSLRAIVNMVEEGWIRPWTGDMNDKDGGKVVPFDKAPEVFRRGADGPVGLLKDGGTCVVRVVA